MKQLQAEKDELLRREAALKQKMQDQVNQIKTDLAKAAPANSLTETEGRVSLQTQNLLGNVNSSFNGPRANFVTSTFGVFNCDRPIPYPNAFNTPILFKSDGGEVIRPTTAYVFDHKQNTRFTYGQRNGRQLDDLAWKNNNSTVILIDEEGNLYYRTQVNELKLIQSTLTLQRISRKDLNLQEIQKIFGEATIST